MCPKSMMRQMVRPHLRRWRAATILIACLGPCSIAHAQEAWETALKLQLEAEKKCELAVIISVRQIPVEGLNALEGRIRCTDNREFDFSRARPHQKFTIQLCQPAVC